MRRVLLLLVIFCTGCGDNRAGTSDRVRAFAQLPDWTGYWDTEWLQAVTNPSGRDEEDLSFQAVLKRVKLLGHAPLNAEAEARYQEALRNAAAAAVNRKLCDWNDFPQAMEAPATFQVLITPEETLMVSHLGTIRHIFTDGRSHPPPDDLWHTRMGHSIGHWENDELVVDTVARTPGPAFVGPSADLSEEAHFTERIRRIDDNTLENRMTIVDPLRFTKPWELTIRYTRAAGLDRLIQYGCEGDRHPVVDGKLVVAPP
jgi:hypothetical protein